MGKKRRGEEVERAGSSTAATCMEVGRGRWWWRQCAGAAHSCLWAPKPLQAFLFLVSAPYKPSAPLSLPTCPNTPHHSSPCTPLLGCIQQTLCDPMDCSPPGSSVHGIPQEYWSGLPLPTLENLPSPEIELPRLLHLLHWQGGSLPLALPGVPHLIPFSR